MPYVDDDDDLDAPFSNTLFESIVFERRVMYGGVVGSILMVGVFAVAIALPDWADIEFPGVLPGETISVDLGIWGEQRTATLNGTITNRTWIVHFPEPSAEFGRLANKQMPHFYRAQAVFAVLTVLLVAAATCAALYSFRNHHHIFKRFAAALYAIAGVTTIVVIEVLVYSIDQWNTSDTCDINVDPKCYHQLIKKRRNLKQGLQFDDYKISYGLSYYLAWIVAVSFIACACLYLYCSRKRSGGMAATQAAAELETLDRWAASHPRET